MDYFDPAAGKAHLAVVKYRATVLKKRGTLFINPGMIISLTKTLRDDEVGGPGGSGVEFVTSFGDRISKEIQGQYDVVSWDPRGGFLYIVSFYLLSSIRNV